MSLPVGPRWALALLPCLVSGVDSPAPAAASSGSTFTVGLAVPDLVLPSLSDGSPRSLADFRGKKVILQVFASW